LFAIKSSTYAWDNATNCWSALLRTPRSDSSPSR
jgi:hypothetical protein